MAITKKEKEVLKKLLREILVLRDGEKCLKCKRPDLLNMSHILPKGTYRRAEFDPDNLKFLCFPCHLHWWHKNPIEAFEWLKSILPQARWQRLMLIKQVVIPNRMDYKLHKLFLESEIKKLKKKR